MADYCRRYRVEWGEGMWAYVAPTRGGVSAQQSCDRKTTHKGFRFSLKV